MNKPKFADLLGQTLDCVTINADRDEVIFRLVNGDTFRLYHERECCESVSIEDIEGEIVDNVLVDLVGDVVLATEDSRCAAADEAMLSGTWTFYRIGTLQGTVVMRWLGQSNGYYSEAVQFDRVSVCRVLPFTTV